MTDAASPSAPSSGCYFADEAGDPVLFNGKGRVLVGSRGCPRYFAVGLLEVGDAVRLSTELAKLRADFLADPQFRKIRSRRPEPKRLARSFRASGDLPEVRREVFKLLTRHDLKFSAVVRDKYAVLNYVRACHERDPAYRYKAGELHDLTVWRLFKEGLPQHDGYTICFAMRGNRHRTDVFQTALEAAQKRWAGEHGIADIGKPDVKASWPTDEPALQAVDYFLWALQRTFERRDDEYLGLLWPQCRLVVDVDDTRLAKEGMSYTRQKPLTAEARPNGAIPNGWGI